MSHGREEDLDRDLLEFVAGSPRETAAELENLRAEVRDLKAKLRDRNARLKLVRKKWLYDLKTNTQTIYDLETDAALDLKAKSWRKARGEGR